MRRLWSLAFLPFAWVALASIGDLPGTILEPLASYGLRPVGDGDYLAAEGFRISFEMRGEVVHGVIGEGILTAANIDFAADLIGVATDYGDDVADPLATFFATRVGEFSSRGQMTLGIEAYVMRLEVSGEAPYRVRFLLVLQEIPEEVFPLARHALGPADARYVIREFSDFQCPFCRRFAAAALPAIRGELLSRGDVRFEFHYFPLQSIHANAALAAEAAECVTAANSPEAFWEYHDALFGHQRDWEALEDPAAFFTRLAGDIGLESAGVAACLSAGDFRRQVQDSYRVARDVLGLTGTPTVFVNGFKVQDYLDLTSYFDLMALIDAFSTRE